MTVLYVPHSLDSGLFPPLLLGHETHMLVNMRSRSGTGPPRGGEGSQGMNELDCMRGHSECSADTTRRETRWLVVAYRGTSPIRNAHPPRTAIGP